MTRVGMMTEMSWEVDKEVNQYENGEADGMNLSSFAFSHAMSVVFILCLFVILYIFSYQSYKSCFNRYNRPP